MKIRNEEALTFDDVLLVPKYSKVFSRKDVNLSSYLTDTIKLDIPIISSNMDTVTEGCMMQEMRLLGGLGILHRFMSVQKMGEILKDLEGCRPLVASLGIDKKDVVGRAHVASKFVDLFCIDVAHGDHQRVYYTIQMLKDSYPNIPIIAGNVATSEGVECMIKSGVAAIKVGIGSGSFCSTRIVTGCGYPQLSAISEAKKASLKYSDGKVKILADGGIRNSGDAVKALAAGADCIILGNMLAGTPESPGKVIHTTEGSYKTYRGMASREAQMDWKGRVSVVEGESKKVLMKSNVSTIISELVSGIQSGLSYCGVDNIQDLHSQAEFVKVTPACLKENVPHGVLK